MEVVADFQAQKMALYFNYHWTLRSGKLISFECMDLLHLNEKRKIISLRIFYDTHLVRPHLN